VEKPVERKRKEIIEDELVMLLTKVRTNNRWQELFTLGTVYFCLSYHSDASHKFPAIRNED